VWLAQKYRRNGHRSLREVAYLLAYLGFLTRSGKPYGPAAIRKMVQTRISLQQQKVFASWWENTGREQATVAALGLHGLKPAYYRKAIKLRRRVEYHWATAQKRNMKRSCFQWLKE
jgi:hypothetical protein